MELENYLKYIYNRTYNCESWDADIGIITLTYSVSSSLIF